MAKNVILAFMALHSVLLIDDDTDDQLFFTEVLEEIDPAIVCSVANNGPEGFDLLRSGTLPEIIFLDLNMPYMNGFDFLKIFHEEPDWSGIPVVLFTTSSHQADRERAFQLGAQAFLTKPHTVSELRLELEKLIG
jgi:CheY-like chemotaxis protein